MQNRFVRSIVIGLDSFFNPMLRPIRRILPDMGGIDLAPMVLILLIMLVQRGLPALLLGSFLGGYVGAHLAHSHGNGLVKPSFEILTVLIGSKLLIDAWPHLT